MPSPALIVACISLIGALSGVAWAATKIGTADIQSRAVTSKKLDQHAVSAGKLRSAAVTQAKLDPRIRGLAVAGAAVDQDGAVTRWFNRLGDKPRVFKETAGRYGLFFPGLDDDENEPFVTDLIGSGTLRDDFGEIRVTTDVGSGGASLLVLTADSDGTLADRAFTAVFYEATSDR